MFRFRCQCLGFIFGLMLSMGVSAATGWLVAEELPARSVPLSTPAADFVAGETVPSPLPLILMASGLLGLVLLVGKRRRQL